MSQKRTKLLIIEEPKINEVGEKRTKKLIFKAKDPEGATFGYFTFTQKLFPYLIKDTEVEVDVDISERENQGVTYIDRKIIQVYINGEPVTGKSGGGGGWGGSGGPRGKSPDELEFDRFRNRSIEAQCCLKEAVNLAGHTGEDNLSHVVDVARIFLKFIDEAHGNIKQLPQGEEQQGRPVPDPEQIIDLGWLQEQLIILQKKDPKQWTNTIVIKDLNAITGKQAKSVSDAVKYLNRQQAADFVKKIIEATVRR